MKSHISYGSEDVILTGCDICANGPAIKVGCVTRRSIRAESWYFSREDVTVQGGYGAVFAIMVQILLSAGAIAVQSFIGAANLSLVTNLIEGTGAVSRYNLSRSQKFITMQNFNCVQMRVSGCKSHYKAVLSARAKAKTVTNNLPILSVLCLGGELKLSR